MKLWFSPTIIPRGTVDCGYPVKYRCGWKNTLKNGPSMTDENS